MSSKTLLSQTGTSGAVGSTATFPSSDTIRIIQFNPQVNAGFTGAVVIQQSYVLSPGSNDWSTLLTATFTGHTSNFQLEVKSTAPSIRATISSAATGAIAVYGDSASRDIQGGTTNGTATVVVDSPNSTLGTGSNYKINSVIVPAITSGEVIYENDFNLTITDVLLGKQDIIGSGAITSNASDLNLLDGMVGYGLVQNDLKRIADINVSSNEINYLDGASSNIQVQIQTIIDGLTTGIYGPATSVSSIDTFFNGSTNPSVTVNDIDNLGGLTATATDLNRVAGYTGSVSDLNNIVGVSATASELSTLSGFTGSSSDLNKLSGISTTSGDLAAIQGYQATGVTSSEIDFLSGLNENVQAALDAVADITGLTSSVDDLNLLSGAFAGTGLYSSPITSSEISYLNGVNSNIQTQIDSKRNTSDLIGIAEISGASITTIELNYLSGASSNIQAQLDTISTGGTYITTSGGKTFTAPFYLDNGSAALPSLGFESPNTTTGFYRYGASGIGMSVSGTRFMSLDGTDVVIGDGVVYGQPSMKGVGMSLTDPAYSFAGDTDTGIYRASANNLAIVAGAESMAEFDSDNNKITIGGDNSSNNVVEINGVFAGIKHLASGTVMAGSSTGTTGKVPLYKVPTGRSLIVTKILVRLTNVVGFSDGSLFRMNIGFGSSHDEIVDNTSNTTLFNPIYGFSTATQVMPLGAGDNTFPAISGSGGAGYQVLTAGNYLKSDVTVLAGATEYDMEVHVFGYEF